MQMLGNFGAKLYYFIFFDPHPVQKSFLHHWGGWYLSTLQTNLAF